MARLVVLDDHLLFAVQVNLFERGEEPRGAAREVHILLRLLLTALALGVLTRYLGLVELGHTVLQGREDHVNPLQTSSN